MRAAIAIISGVVIATLAGCGGHGSSNGACHTLSLEDCRLTDGCTPDICDGCVCDLKYRGCLATAEAPRECPQLGCAGGICCSTQAQCTDQAQCAPPGTPQACGACSIAPGDCTVDTECKARGPTQICEDIPCSCNGQKQCVGGCIDDTTCSIGTHCDLATSRCASISCAGDEGCPPDFHCTGATCVRDDCTDDRDCDGFCVVGKCFGNGRGECRQPSA